MVEAQLHSIFPPCDDCLSVISDPKEDFRPLTFSGVSLPTKSVVTFLSSISPPSKIPSNPASPDELPSLTLLSTSQPPTINPDVAPSASTGSHISISSPEASQSEKTQELLPFSSFLSDVRPLLSRRNHLKLQPDQSALGRQHRREYYTNHAGRTKRRRFIQHLQYCLKPDFCKWEIIFWDGKRQEYTIQSTSPLSTISSTATGNHRTSSLMSLNPLAPTFLPHYQSSGDPRVSLCNSTTMGLLLAQLICRMPPQTFPSHAPSINQHITDGTFLLPLLQPTNQSKPDAAVHQPTPGSSALLPSPLQHQANCLQAINKTIKQFHQHLKAEQLDRQTLQLILLQLQNDFALLWYLLFSPVETISNKDITVKNSATSPQLISKPNLNPNPNHNPTSSVFPLSGSGEPHHHRSTPVGLWDHPEQKQTILQTLIFSRHSNTQEASSTTVENLTS